MTDLATIKMFSKGQVLMPEKIRKRLGLESGSQFVVVAVKGTVIMQAISQPSTDEFDPLIAEARRQAKEARLKQADIDAVISEVRSRK
ncbi:MAG: AbrB/MazE/SpoVT family DNA-binding domain-containing protein [Halieaceae bacterium]|jgi:AbrB family looped-hinge helix DNA binding protein|nr:AbrB/MazE/SpoVT family DNA-binding domain-containing protein [Halieaceae bacterium]